MKEKFKKLKKFFPISGKDALISLAIFAAAIGISLLLTQLVKSDSFVPLIFILAVVFVSRYTNGFFFGIIFSIMSVFTINFLFSYPYYELNFTLTGYPIVFVCTLVVAIVTSMINTESKFYSNAALQAEREKIRINLLRAVSHDLRTPLTSILGASSAIIDNFDKLDKDERLKLVNGIKEDAFWLIRIAENSLSITSIDENAKVAKIVKREEVVEEVVADAVSKFKKHFNVPVLIEVPNEFFLVPMDAMLIEQVIINLLENAVIHGKTATTIKLLVERKGGFCVFTVTDNGKGIELRVLPHIFDDSFKINNENNGDTKKNLGIGLSVCNTIVKAHGGTMTAKNLLVGGACFSFTIPVENEDGQ